MIILDWIIGCCTGLISGIISGILVTRYFRYKDQIRLFIEYAQGTTDHADEIYEEAQEFLETNDPRELKRLLRKYPHRTFSIEIPDEKLHNAAVKRCNQGINAIQTALEEGDRLKLQQTVYDISDILLEAGNAMAEFKIRYNKQGKCEKRA